MSFPRGTDRGRGFSAILLEAGERSGPGCIGARRPDRWLCTLWDAPTILRREMLSDIIGRPPTMIELALSAVNHPERWRAVEVSA